MSKCRNNKISKKLKTRTYKELFSFLKLSFVFTCGYANKQPCLPIRVRVTWP